MNEKSAVFEAMEVSNYTILVELSKDLIDSYKKSKGITESDYKMRDTEFTRFAEKISKHVSSLDPTPDLAKLSIGGSTVESIIKKTYRMPAYGQPPTKNLQVLDLLCVYLQKNGWNNYVREKLQSDNIVKQHLMDIVAKANKELIKYFKNIPNGSVESMALYFIPEGSTFKGLKLANETLSATKRLEGYKTKVEHKIYRIDINVISKYKAIITGIEDFNIRFQKDDYSSIEWIRNICCNYGHYIYILFNNGTEWKIEGKYRSETDYKAIIQKYEEREQSLANVFPVSRIPKVYHPTWHRFLIEDYILPFN